MENNRTILAIALIILIWSGYSMFFPPQKPLQEEGAKSQVAQQTKTSPQPVVPVQEVEVAGIGSKSVPFISAAEQLVQIDSELYHVEFSSIGGRMTSATLKKYMESNDPDSAAVKLIEPGADRFATFRTSGSEGLSLPADLPYALQEQTTSYRLTAGDKQLVSFVGTTQSGLEVRKTFTFYSDSYQIDLDVELINRTEQKNRGVFNLSLINRWDESRAGDRYNFVGPISFNGEKVLEDSAKDLQESSRIYGKETVWSGFVSKYFLSIVNPQAGAAKQIQIELDQDLIESRFISPFVTLEPAQKQTFQYVGFFGPKDYDILKATGHQFDEAIDFGFFSLIAKPLMVVLKFFHNFLGNWGFAIIMLTVCIKALFWPLTQKSYSSMKAMQKLQPQMAKLREKYASDKQRLNQEMMSLYKENRVNPFGGCLPILIQIPVFFALYQVLLGSIELRHAPFMLWINDLSAADTLISDLMGLPFTLGPLPLIMGATMFIQQKMTPSQMDPTQAKIMLMMPVVFTFLFLSFPSGLVIYWLINNVLTIAQQYLINRKHA